MQLNNRNLELDLQGPDVRLLHFELRLLDFDIPEEEAFDNHFGEGTLEAVKIFQEKVGIEVTGIVDEATAKIINETVRENVSIEQAMEQLQAQSKLTVGQIFELDPEQLDLRTQTARLADKLQAFTNALDAVRELDAPDDWVAEMSKILNEGRTRLDELATSPGNSKEVAAALKKLAQAVRRTLSQIEALDPSQFNLRAEIARFNAILQGFDTSLAELSERGASAEGVAQVQTMLNAAHSRLQELADGLDDSETTLSSVSGRITQRDGTAIVGARVRVLEQQVVSTQNSVLGILRSDEAGGYELQHEHNVNMLPDLVVEVLAQQGEEIITRSPLIVDAAPEQTVDLIVDNAEYPPASEFDQIEARLQPLLTDTGFDQIDSDSVSFLSGKTGISPIRISEFVQAQRFAQEGEVSAQVYYGLFRANLPVNKPALVAQDNALLAKAITATSTANVIDPGIAQNAEMVDSAVATINREMVDTLIAQPMLPSGEASLGAFLDIAALNEEQKITVVQEVQATTDRGADF